MMSKNYRGLFIRGMLFINVALVVCTLMAYVSPHVDLDDTPFFSFFGLTYAGQLIFHILFVVWWIVLLSRYVCLSAVFIIFEIFVFNHVVNFKARERSYDISSSFTIASYNMQFSSQVYAASSDSKNEFKRFLSHLREIDILCVQECGDRSKDYVIENMTFPYHYFPYHSYVGIYSKFPIIDSGVLSEGFSGANTCIWIDIVFNNDTLRFYNAHLESNRSDGIVPLTFDENKAEKISNIEMLGVLKHYFRFTKKRNLQAKIIHQEIINSPYPIILCGDFNEVSLTSVYRNISKDLSDTFVERGCGIGTTLDINIPGLRIDYILSDPQMKVLSHDIEKGTYSDHFLVRARLSY